MAILQFIHLSVKIPLDSLHFVAIMNNAAMNIVEQIFIWIYVFNSLRYIPRREIAGSYTAVFNF